MIQLTNAAPVTLAPGASLTFDTVLLDTGCAECHRKGSAIVTLNRSGAIYEIAFSANIGASAAGTAQLAITLDGEPLPEAYMNSTTAAAGDFSNVAVSTFVKTCCRGGDTVAVRNTGTTTVTVGSANLAVGRWN